MTPNQDIVYPAENSVKISFETKRASMYVKAREFDKIPPETPIDLVVFSVENPFAKKWRKMLH